MRKTPAETGAELTEEQIDTFVRDREARLSVGDLTTLVRELTSEAQKRRKKAMRLHAQLDSDTELSVVQKSRRAQEIANLEATADRMERRAEELKPTFNFKVNIREAGN